MGTRQIDQTSAKRPLRKGLRSGVTNELSIFLEVIPSRVGAIREAAKAADGDPRRLKSFTNREAVEAYED